MGFSSAAVAKMGLSDDFSSTAETKWQQQQQQQQNGVESQQRPLSSIDEAESMIDLSALLIEKGGRLSPEPPMAEESDVSSVSTRNSIASFAARDSFFDDSSSVQKSPSPTPAPDHHVASPTASPETQTTPPRRKPLQWEFSGLTLWIELEEFDSDLTRCIEHVSQTHGTERIPQSHMTAIYGMEHLTNQEACERLRSVVPSKIKSWPKFRKPIGIVQDVAVAGNPGQVCSIAWAQLTLASSSDHEDALDVLYDVFYGEDSTEKAERHRPWTPHNSFAYDNPEDTVLSMENAFEAVAKYPTLLSRERNVAAISLWDTNGKMGSWKCLERVRFD
mmetsp:Transcript_38115/g.77573  ORF Transcript_38115/g.77573 Transcript_38115/m.77573 type:complete len:333 (-) Transcript_38115:4695-5693(-)